MIFFAISIQRCLVGLDDYPRAATPSTEEEHVDLLSWMMFFSRTMADIAHVLGQDATRYTETYTRLAGQLQGWPLTPLPCLVPLHSDVDRIRLLERGTEVLL